MVDCEPCKPRAPVSVMVNDGDASSSSSSLSAVRVSPLNSADQLSDARAAETLGVHAELLNAVHSSPANRSEHSLHSDAANSVANDIDLLVFPSKRSDSNHSSRSEQEHSRSELSAHEVAPPVYERYDRTVVNHKDTFRRICMSINSTMPAGMDKKYHNFISSYVQQIVAQVNDAKAVYKYIDDFILGDLINRLSEIHHVNHDKQRQFRLQRQIYIAAVLLHAFYVKTGAPVEYDRLAGQLVAFTVEEQSHDLFVSVTVGQCLHIIGQIQALNRRPRPKGGKRSRKTPKRRRRLSSRRRVLNGYSRHAKKRAFAQTY